MDGVVALANRAMRVQASRQCTKDQKEWRALVHMELNKFHIVILLDPVFFWTALPCSGYHLERGGMPLHDAVSINCEKRATTENQGTGVKYMAQGCMFMIVFAICLDRLSLLG